MARGSSALVVTLATPIGSIKSKISQPEVFKQGTLGVAVGDLHRAMRQAFSSKCATCGEAGHSAQRQSAVCSAAATGGSALGVTGGGSIVGPEGRAQLPQQHGSRRQSTVLASAVGQNSITVAAATEMAAGTSATAVEEMQLADQQQRERRRQLAGQQQHWDLRQQEVAALAGTILHACILQHSQMSKCCPWLAQLSRHAACHATFCGQRCRKRLRSPVVEQNSSFGTSSEKLLTACMQHCLGPQVCICWL
jgi:hypothetical protein